jgi:hypothetical protein
MMMIAPASVDSAAPPASIESLYELAAAALPRMYRQPERRFVFTERAAGAALAGEGRSDRYSAIALIGLASIDRTIAPFTPAERRAIAAALVERVSDHGLGDAALIAWAAALSGVPAEAAWARIEALAPAESTQPTVQLAWALTALCVARDHQGAALRARVAERLMAAYAERGRVFPPVVGEAALRSHVSCFADQVYPIQALAEYSRATGDRRALAIADGCAARICALQGDAGQWWWHYDARSGTVLEEYPVYAIHQDAMAPMALFALARAGGTPHEAAVSRGLHWLAASPELAGGTLIDLRRGTVWRKVARREPGKTSRYLHAAASRLREGARMPGLQHVFAPGAIDLEDRPYHWGWFLYAWAHTLNRTA